MTVTLLIWDSWEDRLVYDVFHNKEQAEQVEEFMNRQELSSGERFYTEDFEVRK